MTTHTVKPFDFADLNGKPEPESWGPIYPKTASAAVEKFRTIAKGRALNDIEAAAYSAAIETWIRGLNAPKKTPNTFGETTNAPSGQKGEFSDAKHRAKLKAEFAADAARDRREWALGKLKDSAGHTIAQAYALAMVAKANRLRARSVGLEAVRAALFGAVEFAEAA